MCLRTLGNFGILQLQSFGIREIKNGNPGMLCFTITLYVLCGPVFAMAFYLSIDYNSGTYIGKLLIFCLDMLNISASKTLINYSSLRLLTSRLISPILSGPQLFYLIL